MSDHALRTQNRQTRQRRRTDPLLAEVLLAAAEHLPRADAALIRAVYGKGRTVREFADLIGVPAPRLRRRLRTLLRRINDPVFVLVAREQAGWPALMRDVAGACFLHGLTIRKTAEILHLSYHTVRRHRAAVLDLAAMEQRSLHLARRAG